MKKSNKYILIGIFSIFFIIPIYLPLLNAQEWTYNGVDTDRIPEFFVYPSERYYYNYSGAPPLFYDETYVRYDIVKGNITDTFMGMTSIPAKPPLVNGTCIFGDVYMGNTTSGEEVLVGSEYHFVYWNETIGLVTLNQYPAIFIPVDEYGEATVQSLNIASESIQWAVEVAGFGRFEHNASYPNIYSVELWNSTHNNCYWKMNFTENGQQINTEIYNIANAPNITLISRPAQMSPIFTFSTDDDILSVDSTDLTLIVNVTDADNNNDGIIDTDYHYRIYNGTVWTTWAAIPATIAYDLGNVATGNYDITMEVKNMYGYSSHQIQIQYTAPNGNGGNGEPPEIPGYSIILTSIIILLGILFLNQKIRKNK